jgi:hypothetical protein
MTVTTTANTIRYAGNGITTAFAFPFIFFKPTDLVVTLHDISTFVDVVPPPALNGGGTYDYTVTGVLTDGEYASGGTVTFNTAPAGTLTVVLLRAVPATQEVTLIDNTKFPANTINTEFDKLTVLAQQALLPLQSGAGPPTGLTATKGTLYTNTTATTTTTRLYINTDGGTTWASFTASA